MIGPICISAGIFCSQNSNKEITFAQCPQPPENFKSQQKYKNFFYA